MNREIRYKAKRCDNKQWVEGSLIVLDADSGYYFITEEYLSASTLPVKDLIYNHTYLVNPNTLCQYTGLTDNNGNKIWENDILHCKNRDMVEEADFTTQVEWDDDCKGFLMQDTAYSFVGLDAINPNIQGIYEVVEHLGNVFDNPELLKSEF